jgi:uncharacterized membrane protein (DUF106 family)
MPIKYTLKQKQERIDLLNAKITIAKAEGDMQEVKRLQNLRGSAKAKFGL